MLFSEAQLKAIAKAVASNYGNPSKSEILAYIRKHPSRKPVLLNDGASKAQILLAYYEVISWLSCGEMLVLSTKQRVVIPYSSGGKQHQALRWYGGAPEL